MKRKGKKGLSRPDFSMKKKLLSIVTLASLMVLGGCGNKESANPTTPKPTETSRPTENLPTEPVVKDAATRHKEYLENYGDKTKSITIQGKVIHAVSYPGKDGAENPNCNIAIQEGKYGYWMNNVPKASIEIGKSYVFTVNSRNNSIYIASSWEF